jgi:hypothetical protein
MSADTGTNPEAPAAGPTADAQPMAAARQPVGTGRLGLVGVVLPTLLILLGLVGIRDALVSAGVLAGDSWIEGGITALDGLEPQWWAVPAGVVAALLGLWLVAVALRPRPKSSVPVRARTGVYVRARDLGRLAARAAENVDGVLDADASATRKTVTVKAKVTADDGGIADDVRRAVDEAFSALDPAPRVRVRTESGDLS